MDVKAVQAELARFAAERGWDDAQTPKNLAMALAIESSVVLELFKWQRDDAAGRAESARLRDSAADAIADVILQALRLADRLEVDVDRAVADRLARNAAKYPAAPGEAAGEDGEVIVLEIGLDDRPDERFDEQPDDRPDDREVEASHGLGNAPAHAAFPEPLAELSGGGPQHAAPIEVDLALPGDLRSDAALARADVPADAPPVEPHAEPLSEPKPAPAPRVREREVSALERPKPVRAAEPEAPEIDVSRFPTKSEGLPSSPSATTPPSEPAAWFEAKMPRPAPVEARPAASADAARAPEHLSVTPLTLPTQPPPVRSDAEPPVDRYPNLDPDAALALVKTMAKKLDQARSRDPLLRELHDELETLKRSLYAPSVKKAWVAGSLKTLRGMLEQATSEPFGEEIDATGHMAKVDRLLKE